MPTFSRNFINSKSGTPDPNHLERVGPRLPVEVSISGVLASQYTKDQRAIPPPVSGFALFDSGASNTCIDEGVLSQLGLAAQDNIDISTPSEKSVRSRYIAKVSFPDCPLSDIDPAVVIGVVLRNQGYIALLGRDLMRDMLVIYDGPGARVTFAF